MKIKEFEPRRGAHVPGAPLDPPLVCVIAKYTDYVCDEMIHQSAIVEGTFILFSH